MVSSVKFEFYWHEKRDHFQCDIGKIDYLFLCDCQFYGFYKEILGGTDSLDKLKLNGFSVHLSEYSQKRFDSVYVCVDDINYVYVEEVIYCVDCDIIDYINDNFDGKCYAWFDFSS